MKENHVNVNFLHFPTFFVTRVPAQDPSNTEPEDHKARQRDSLGA